MHEYAGNINGAEAIAMTCTFIKQRFLHRCFLVNFTKFLRTPILFLRTPTFLLGSYVAKTKNRTQKSEVLFFNYHF